MLSKLKQKSMIWCIHAHYPAASLRANEYDNDNERSSSENTLLQYYFRLNVLVYVLWSMGG